MGLRHSSLPISSSDLLGSSTSTSLQLMNPDNLKSIAQKNADWTLAYEQLSISMSYGAITTGVSKGDFLWSVI